MLRVATCLACIKKSKPKYYIKNNFLPNSSRGMKIIPYAIPQIKTTILLKFS